MPVTPQLLLESAKALAGGEAEVDQRNAASRAYYAAYHRCLPIAQRFGLPARPEHVHRDLIDTLKTTRDNRLKSIAYMLNQCRKIRVDADYEINVPFTQGEAQTALSQCERIINQADSFDA